MLGSSLPESDHTCPHGFLTSCTWSDQPSSMHSFPFSSFHSDVSCFSSIFLGLCQLVTLAMVRPLSSHVPCSPALPQLWVSLSSPGCQSPTQSRVFTFVNFQLHRVLSSSPVTNQLCVLLIFICHSVALKPPSVFSFFLSCRKCLIFYFREFGPPVSNALDAVSVHNWLVTQCEISDHVLSPVSGRGWPLHSSRFSSTSELTRSSLWWADPTLSCRGCGGLDLSFVCYQFHIPGT